MKMTLFRAVPVLILLIYSGISVAAQSTAFTYQGQLTYKGALANGNYDLQFALYDAGGKLVAGPIPTNGVAVVNGLLTVRLDFGAGVFTGPPRWMEISVRPAVGVATFSVLTPRQEVTSSPYAIFAATVANGVVTANQLNTAGLAPKAGQFLSYNGGNLFWSDPGAAAGNIWSRVGTDAYYTAGNIGIGTNAPTPGVRLEVNGNVRIKPAGGSGGFLQIGTPNGESGLSFQGTDRAATNRADIRYDGYTLKLVAGTVGPPAPSAGVAINPDGKVGIGTIHPVEKLTVGGDVAADTKLEINSGGNTYAALRLYNSSASWLWQVTPKEDLPGGRIRLTDEWTGLEPMSITHDGNVGIGTTAPAHHLSVIGGPFWTANKWIGALELNNASAIGWRHDPGGQRFGIGQSTGGLYIFRTDSDPGATGSPAKYDVQVTDNGTLQAYGNATQAQDKGGFAKAMIHVNAHGLILDCYNGTTGASFTGASFVDVCGSNCCGFKITAPADLEGVYVIDFGFPVNHRFVSVTAEYRGGFSDRPYNRGANYLFNANPNVVEVYTFVADNADDTAQSRFTIIVH